VQLQAIWFWLDVVSGPLLVGCCFLGRHKEVTWVLNIKFSVSPEFHGYGHGYRAPRTKLTSGILLAGTCEKSRSETLPAHLGGVLGNELPRVYGNHDLK
jgi:hypothetical protein